ncbi:MAG: hypothetical protein M3Y65_09950 [Pseudomonadota bacterium]|nr:hypothetical protein [Pseudomonadota bacterium]
MPQLQLEALRLGPTGIQKHIYLGVRGADAKIDFIESFIEFVRTADRYSLGFRPKDETIMN